MPIAVSISCVVSTTEQRLHDGNYLDSHTTPYFVSRQAQRFGIEDDHIPFLQRGQLTLTHLSLTHPGIKFQHTYIYTISVIRVYLASFSELVQYVQLFPWTSGSKVMVMCGYVQV